MSNQESSSVLTAPEATLSLHAKTGTSVPLKITVNGSQAMISDPSPKIHNGDTVVWTFAGLTGTPTLEIKFTRPMLSIPGKTGTFEVTVDIIEEDGARVVTAPYEVTVGVMKLSFVSSFEGVAVYPELVIDSMGGM